MIVYFTGTGNSRYCAHALARQLGEETLDAFSGIRSGQPAQLRSERPWVFVSPTYGWRIPRVFEAFIRKSGLSGSREAYFVMTCGSEIGAPEPYLQALCREKGLRFRGVLEVVMPENYIALFDAPEAAEARRIVAAARPALEVGAACIRAERDFPARRPGGLDRVRSQSVNPRFYRFVVKAKKFYATDRCVSCGKCAAVCPLGNICLEGGRPIWGDRCTHCMACICLCPAEAIEYGRASRGKPRYRCPEDV